MLVFIIYNILLMAVFFLYQPLKSCFLKRAKKQKTHPDMPREEESKNTFHDDFYMECNIDFLMGEYKRVKLEKKEILESNIGGLLQSSQTQRRRTSEKHKAKMKKMEMFHRNRIEVASSHSNHISESMRVHLSSVESKRKLFEDYYESLEGKNGKIEQIKFQLERMAVLLKFSESQIKNALQSKYPCDELIGLIHEKILTRQSTIHRKMRKSTNVTESLFTIRRITKRRLVPQMQSYDIMANEKYPGLNHLLVTLELCRDSDKVNEAIRDFEIDE